MLLLSAAGPMSCELAAIEAGRLCLLLGLSYAVPPRDCMLAIAALWTVITIRGTRRIRYGPCLSAGLYQQPCPRLLQMRTEQLLHELAVLHSVPCQLSDGQIARSHMRWDNGQQCDARVCSEASEVDVKWARISGHRD